VPSPAPKKHREFSSDVRPWRAWLAWLVALIVLFGASQGSAQDVPIPPAPQRWVTDQAGLMSAPARSALDAKLEAYERDTGHQVVVFIGQTIGDRPLDDFAVKTFEAWKIGRKGHDDGILVIVLARDRKMAIEVGYGLEGQVPDAVASRIINDVMAPKLRAGDADGAIAAGVASILQSVEGKPYAGQAEERRTEPVAKRPSTLKLIGLGIIALVFLVIFLTNPALALQLLFVMASGRGRHGGGGFGGGGFGGGGGRSGGGGARGSW
jgi:uncharacterized protein